MAGKLTIVIGPNGFGKTTYLDEKKKELESDGETAILIPSEITLTDELKDGRDTTLAMSNIVSELIKTKDYEKSKDELFETIKDEVNNNKDFLNNQMKEILSANGTTWSGDVITANESFTVLKHIKIDKTILNEAGSGQRMQFILILALISKKKNILIDEPEKYSHPSMLHKTAELINKLINADKNVYLASHSPKLLSMIQMNLKDIYIINDKTHKEKPIEFKKAIEESKKAGMDKFTLPNNHKPYYENENTLQNAITKRHLRTFMECLFSKNIIICEGINDLIYVNNALNVYGYKYQDYTIFTTWGKYNMPVFIALFKNLGINTIVLHDKDDESEKKHKYSNKAIVNLKPDNLHIFTKHLEDEVSFPEKKKSDYMAFCAHVESLNKKDIFDLKI